MDTNLKSTEPKGTDVFKGAISWICSLLLLCGLTTGLLVLLFIALDPQLAGGLGEAFINLTYGEYPRWLPVAAVSVILFVAALLALLFAFRKDRHDFENMLAAWLAKIWVEVKLLVIVAVVLVAILLDFGTTLGGMITPVVAVVFLYFLCLDIGKNRQFFRHNIVHSLLKALNSYRDLTGFEQRSLRRLLSTLAVIVGVLGVSAATFLSLLRVAQSPIRDFFLLGVVGFAAAGVIGSIFWYTLALKRDLRDWSVLLAQIAEMYGGNLNAVNHIPPTSNLYDCAMQLNMIRTGIQKAVEEGIKADRTKVELITNVSHDIKDAADLHHQLCGAAKKRAGPAAPRDGLHQDHLPKGRPAEPHCAGRVRGVQGGHGEHLPGFGGPGHRQAAAADLRRDGGGFAAVHLGLAGGDPRHAHAGPRRRPAAVPGVPEPDSQLRPVRPGGLPGVREPDRPAQPRRGRPGHGDDSEHLTQRNHHGCRPPDGPFRPGGPEPHHRGQRPGAVHCQELYRGLRRPV